MRKNADQKTLLYMQWQIKKYCFIRLFLHVFKIVKSLHCTMKLLFQSFSGQCIVGAMYCWPNVLPWLLARSFDFSVLPKLRHHELDIQRLTDMSKLCRTSCRLFLWQRNNNFTSLVSNIPKTFCHIRTIL